MAAIGELSHKSSMRAPEFLPQIHQEPAAGRNWAHKISLQRWTDHSAQVGLREFIPRQGPQKATILKRPEDQIKILGTASVYRNLYHASDSLLQINHLTTPKIKRICTNGQTCSSKNA